MDLKEKIKKVIPVNDSLAGIHVQKINEGKAVENNLNALWSVEEFRGVVAVFNKKYTEAKQHFYLCGRIDEKLIKEYDSGLLSWGTNHISYAYLSDNPELINRYNTLASSKNNTGTASKAMQHANLLNLSALEEDIHYMNVLKDKGKTKGERVFYDISLNFFQAFMDKNERLMEETLREFVSPSVIKLRKNDQLANSIISTPAAGYAKIAWFHGFELEINDPLIPQELLPINPNEEYHDVYPFL